MSFFEDELKKMFGGNNSPIRDARYTGRACIGRLGDTTNVKLEFETMGTYQEYEAIKASVFNRNDGLIDSSTFRFEDIIGKKRRGEKNFTNGVSPYVWIYDGKIEWYAFKPTAADYAAIAGAVNSYLEVFLEPAVLSRQADKQSSRADGREYTSVLDTIKEDKAKPRQPGEKSARVKKNNREDL